MRRRLPVRILILVALAAAAFTGPRVHGTPAKADCLYAEAYYQLGNPTKHYLIGPKKCVLPTGWPTCGGTGPIRAGFPDFAYTEEQVWLPCPIAA
jgi:hypothetical protein